MPTQEQKISDEKFAELQIKIEEYSEVFNTESSACQKTSKLPTIVENDKLEKEVRSLFILLIIFFFFIDHFL